FTPNGGEVFPATKDVDITWRTALLGGGTMVDIALVRDSDPLYSLPLVTSGSNTGIYQWTVPDTVPAADDYRIQIDRSVGGPALSDASDASFSITEPISFYYVNDADVSGDVYTTAVGNDANDGLAPDRPKASIRSVIESYSLGPGDTILVDNGAYTLGTNLVLDAALSGIRIQGPDVAGAEAILDRGNLAAGNYVFEFDGADDVTITNLSITGAHTGIFADHDADSDQISIVNNRIYDNDRVGVSVGTHISSTNDGWQIVGNEIFGHRPTQNPQSGIGVFTYRVDAAVRDNLVYGNYTGIKLWSRYNISFIMEAEGNRVHGNEIGIEIYGGGTRAYGNTVYDNIKGITGTNSGGPAKPADIDHNIVYRNDLGLELVSGTDDAVNATVNRVFGNTQGLKARTSIPSSYERSSGKIAGNVFYDNSGVSVEVVKASSGMSVGGNTFYEPAGNAIHLTSQSELIDFRNNLFYVGDGFAYVFDADSQSNHTFDYNQYDLGPGGKMADRGSTTVNSFADWRFELGRDANGLAGPLDLVDPDGADNILGDSFAPAGVPTIVDDGDAGFATTGTWTSYATGGYLDDYQTLFGTSGDATWSFAGLTSGQTYEVFATWRNVGYSPDVVYTLTTEGQAAVSHNVSQYYQELSDYVDGDGLGWKRLGTVIVGSDGLLDVRSHNNHPGYSVAADGVIVRPIQGFGGTDDDFHLQFGAPGVDAGDPSDPVGDEPSPNGGRLNLGAYGGTSEATASAGAEILQVLSPSGLDKYSAGRVLPIRWRSQAAGTVDILLYAAAGFVPGVSTPVAIVASGIDGTLGAFDWSIPTDGSIAVDQAYLIAVAANGGSMPGDVSGVFLIANSGNDYYVNDASLEGDVFTTAVGDNLNSGKRADQPLASLAAVLNAYQLGAGDVIHVDTGEYTLRGNLILGDALSGIRIEGPGVAGAEAVLDRGNTANGSYVFEFIGADDVTIANLAITGAYDGVFADYDADSDQVQILENRIYGNANSGVSVGGYSGTTNEGWQIVSNEVFGHRMSPTSGQGIFTYRVDAQVRDNDVYGNAYGIYLAAHAFDNFTTRAENNHVYDNDQGISATDGGTRVIGNTVYDNRVGIHGQNSSGPAKVTDIVDNIVYRNQLGIELLSGLDSLANATGNRVFGNTTGIATRIGQYNGPYNGKISGNVIYDNHTLSMQIGRAGSNVSVEGNTFFEPTGSVIHVTDQSQGIDFRNNLFYVGDGFAYVFGADSQSGHTANYNQYELGPGGKMADRGSSELVSFADWRFELGLDTGGLSAPLGLVDPDGADDILGDSSITVGTPTMIDDGDAGFATTGSWTIDATSGYLGDLRYLYGTEGDATWSFTGLTAGQTYELLATFPSASTSYSSDVRYSFTTAGQDAGFQNISQYNQQLTDYVDGDGVGWKRLGAVVAGGDGMLNVRLKNNRSISFVAADGLLVRPVQGFGAGDDDFHLQLGAPGVDAGDPSDPVGDEPQPNGGRLNLGAYGGTSEATASAGAEILQVLSPTVLDNYSAGRVLSIDWRTPAAGTVDIVLYDANGFVPGVSTPLTTIATGIDAALGTYDWTIPDDGSIATEQSYQLGIFAGGGTMPFGYASGPFMIGSAGNAFYVNDASLAGDQYTSAIGDNANSGKLPSQPMASLAAVLNTYALGAGDVIYVDTGTYGLHSNIVLDASHSGVRIQGPDVVGVHAVLDRMNTSDGAYVLDFNGADDVTVANLSITGANFGIHVDRDSDSDRVTIRDNRIYDNALRGISIGGYLGTSIDDLQVIGNEVFGHVAQNAFGVGIGVYQAGTTVRENTLYGNDTGILMDGASISVGNTVHGNSKGIRVHSYATADSNQVFNNQIGIDVSVSGKAIGNEVHGNVDGLVGGTPYDSQMGAEIIENHVYANSGTGIKLYRGTAARNVVYSNSLGIHASHQSWGFFGNIVSNLVYGNTNGAVLVEKGYDDGAILNNTIYQRVGDALRIENSSRDLLVYNNILMVDSGHSISVDANSQSGHSMDRNLFHQSSDPNAHLGLWGATVLDSLAEWQTTTSLDANSVAGDPLFLDIDGADNVLGYTGADGGYDGGPDDNFYRVGHSIAIDRGDSWNASNVDITGAPHTDDLGTPNLGAPGYFEIALAGSTFPTGGTSLGISTWGNASLPFSFPYFGNAYTSAFVSADGFLQFGGWTAPPYGDNDFAAFVSNARIAPLWDDLNLSPTGKDVFVDSSVADQVTYRWEASLQSDGSDVATAVTLHSDGRIDFHYGAGNQNLTPTVGLSAGNGTTYFLASYDSMANLSNAAPIRIQLQPGIVDIGAYEFLGDSNDNQPPAIIDTVPAAIHQAGQYTGPNDPITLQLSEPISPIDARSTAAYQILFSGTDGVFGNTDDQLIDFEIDYATGSTDITLIPNDPLQTGSYRLTAYGDVTLHDLSGVRLDGDGNGTAGGNYVREFVHRVNHPATVSLTNVVSTLPEDADVSSRVKVADVVITDDGVGTNQLSLSGSHASLFEIDASVLYLRQNALLDFEVDPALEVIVEVEDPSVSGTPDHSVTHGLSLTQVIGLDYGDAPVAYPSTLAEDGARHVSVGPRFGPTRDRETDAIVSPAADGDDNPGEDIGIVFGTIRTDRGTAEVTVDLYNADTAKLDAWIDFNQNGSWDAWERVFGDMAVVRGSQSLTFNVPPSAREGMTIARLRVSSDSGLAPTGLANDGEVEDVQVEILAPPSIESVLINGGSLQRSSVSQIEITFDRIVSAPPEAFVVTNHDNGEVVSGLNVLTSAVDGKTVSLITFSEGTSVVLRGNGFYALADGNYRLAVNADLIVSENASIAMTHDFIIGADAADSFFSLFGDSDGDRDVDGQDYGRFGLTFLKSVGDDGFNPIFDSDGDGDVDGQDYGRFGLRFLKVLPH
uniref:right-handed parallel beta-helix repeat-containing protein n=1 Tax=Stieleria sp. TaxID=2795976 RepID=UPI00356B3B79